MSCKALLALGLCVAFALPAAAQQTPAPPPAGAPAQQASTSPPANTPAPGQKPSASNGDGMAIQARLTQDLGKAGFTHVEVMPESFLVRAQDKDGRPVMMVINPDSITSVTAMNQATGGQPHASPSASPSKK